MIILKAIFLYFAIILGWVLIKAIWKSLVLAIYSFIVNKLTNKQEELLESNKTNELIQSVKNQYAISDFFICWLVPYFPEKYLPNKNDSFAGLLIKQKILLLELIKYYLINLFPLRIINVIFIIFIIYKCTSYKNFPIGFFSYNAFYDNTKDVLDITSPVLLVVLILISYYFTSRIGLFKRAKNKIDIKVYEDIIMFHKNNRMFLMEIENKGFNNLDWSLRSRKTIIRENKNIDFNNLSENCKHFFDLIEEIPEINGLKNFVKEKLKNNDIRDLSPFFIGFKSLSFLQLHLIYNFTNEEEFIERINSIYMTPNGIKSFINDNKNKEEFSVLFNAFILKNLRLIVHINKYLEVINRKLNQKNSLFSILAFITNKQ